MTAETVTVPMRTDPDTERPLAVVTGGAGGIGLVIVRALLRDGFRVVAGDVDREAGARLAGLAHCRYRYFDATDDASVRALFDGLGTVAVLVNNVGIRGGTGALWGLDIDDFRRTLDANLVSHVLACQQVIPGMIAARRGSIVNIASIAARAGLPGRAPYGLSKWGVLGLTGSLASELGPYGIRANAVLPGLVRGERFERSMALHAQAEGITPAQAFERMAARLRLKRYTEPEEVAEMVAYLASERACGITGAFMDVNGGFE